jgi:phosphoglycerate kinase
MKSIKELTNIKGKRVLLRVDFNVPINDGKVEDDSRVKKALPTINYLRKQGAKIVIISHIGRDPKDSLELVAKVLKHSIPVTFIPSVLGKQVDDAIDKMKNGDVIILENLRSITGEKKNDASFARGLSKHGDIYVNEAFPVSHRADASIVGIPKFLPSYAGLQMELEVKELSRALVPEHPFLVIFGGSKAETKIPLIKRYLKDADHVFVGGALVNNFYKAKGLEIGKSVVDNDAKIPKSFLNHKKLILPDMVVVSRSRNVAIKVEDVKENNQILDIGIPSINRLAPLIHKAKLILWNGPMGWYENDYVEATDALVKLLINTKAKVIIGGGDTAVFVEKKKLAKNFTFVSSGGGATLEFLSKGTLPGIKALK